MTTTALLSGLRALEGLAAARVALHVGTPFEPTDPQVVDPTLFAGIGGRERPTGVERVVLMLALAPHVDPGFLDRVVSQALPDGGEVPAFGGVHGEHHRGVLPTGETAQFVLAGDDLAERIEVQRLFSSEHWFARDHVVWLAPVREGEPAMSGRLILDPEVVERLTTGTVSLPRFSTEFPAEHVFTDMEWEDIVLPAATLQQLREIENWVRFNDTVMGEWGMGRRVKPGYRALFHGPPGTGKTLTAALLGRSTSRPVFRIDLSRVSSKYIGETEKNLARLFDRAEQKDWILFFDEADALFGKRTDIRDSHDRYANQEVAYLLQRIESLSTVVILATNQRANIDDAFLRRFQASIRFTPPQPLERREIWERVFPAQLRLEDDVDWKDIAARYELTGAGIVNVAQFCAIEALAASASAVDREFLEAAILRELVKEGRMI